MAEDTTLSPLFAHFEPKMLAVMETALNDAGLPPVTAEQAAVMAQGIMRNFTLTSRKKPINLSLGSTGK